MKRSIPPEIDALMWQLAESDNVVAREEFERRHVVYGPELARRIQMVAELKQAGKSASVRPRFVPRPVRTAPASNLAMGLTIGLAAVAAIAVAVVVLDRPSAAPTVENPQKIQTPVTQNRPPSTQEFTPSPIEPPVVQSPPPSSLPENAPPEPKTPDYRKPRDVRLADVPLPSAIALVAANTGLKVEVAPGFESTKVSIDYRGMTPIEALTAMGKEYGFSVLEQEEGHVLVLPVKPAEIPGRRIGP